jgi:hypothetical protein
MSALFSWLKRPEPTVIEFRSYNDEHLIPLGLFRVEVPDGTMHRGLKHAVHGLIFDASDAALIKAGIAIPTDDELDARPLVRRHAMPPSTLPGQITTKDGSLTVITTDSLDEWDGAVKYDGVNAGPKHAEDPRAQLDGGLWGGNY